MACLGELSDIEWEVFKYKDSEEYILESICKFLETYQEICSDWEYDERSLGIPNDGYEKYSLHFEVGEDLGQIYVEAEYIDPYDEVMDAQHDFILPTWVLEGDKEKIKDYYEDILQQLEKLEESKGLIDLKANLYKYYLDSPLKGEPIGDKILSLIEEINCLLDEDEGGKG